MTSALWPRGKLIGGRGGFEPQTPLGAASYPVDSKTKVGLLHLADEAMYLVKNTSRDNVAAANVGIVPA